MFFISNGGASAVVEMLTKNNFMPLADVATKRSAYLSVLKLTKAVLTVTAHLLLRCESETNRIGAERLRIISEATQVVPNPVNDSVLRRVAESVSLSLMNHVSSHQNQIFRVLSFEYTFAYLRASYLLLCCILAKRRYRLHGRIATIVRFCH